MTRNHLTKTCISFFFCCLCGLLYAQTDSIDVFIHNEMKKRRIPGLQLAIVRDGKIIKTGNYGLANVQDSVPVSDKTVFTINSITKAFAGVAVMQLVEAGKLSLAARVSDYLADLPVAWKAVTIQQLLSHTSGIPDIVDEEESVLIAPDPELAWNQVLALPMAYAPGEKFRYNQTNYLLLGRVIDKLSGMPFADFITREQLLKVGMPRTVAAGFGATKEVIAHAAAGYQYRKGKLNNMFFSFPPFLQTAAGMSSTASELARWIIALQKKELLKKAASMEALWAPAILSNGKTGGFNSLLNGYAAGWPVIEREAHPAVASVGGGRSALFVYPNDKLSIIVLTNLSGGSPDAFIDEIAGLFIADMKEANGFGLSASIRSVRKELEVSGYKNAIAVTNRMRLVYPAFVLPEKEVNSWGYKLLKQNRPADALDIFLLNVALYNTSANAFDSLGEMYARMDNKVDAIRNYERSLQLDPQNSHAAEQLKKLK